MGARHRTNRGKQFHVPCAHRSEDVKHKHQQKAQTAPDQAGRDAGQSSKYRVHGNAAGKGRKYKRIGDAAIPYIVVRNDDRQRDQQNYVYDGFGHFIRSSAGLHPLITGPVGSSRLTGDPTYELVQLHSDGIAE